MASEIPIIDISSYLARGDDASKVVESVRNACQHLGFLVISGHGVSESLMQSMRSVSTSFFDLPMEEKLKYRAVTGVTLGYSPLNTEYLAATRGQETPPDLKESFDIRRPQTSDSDYYLSEMGRYFFRPFVWPDHPDDFEKVWTDYYAAMTTLSQQIMQIFAEALDLPRDYFEPRMDKGVDFLRVINYPGQDQSPAPGQLRAGEHTDYGTLTIVAVDDAEGGLQVQSSDGSWIDAPAIPGTFVINLGDMMAHWTENRWVSTLHRVVNPSEGTGASARRMSLVFFQNPNYDTRLESLGQGSQGGDKVAVTAGEWYRDKATKSKNPGTMG
jgi:isopenicillin N synthase-like dioxygenase